MKQLKYLLLFLSLACVDNKPRVIIETSEGKIEIELYEKKAPVTVRNFLQLVDQKRYDGAEFYRVVTPDNQPGREIKIEVVQGGLQYVSNIDSVHGIAHEITAKSGIRHLDGTISMARDKPGSASTEFFICIGDQPDLDYGGRRNPDGQGFAAFGKVIQGMELVRRIQKMPADSNQVLINRVRLTHVYRE